MRKRTVQSVLARRHMFKNGGMVPPPAQPAGILASSPSLVDAVSNDALSDMGGGTLSMAQGGAAVNMQPSYVFNQGGIAKFNPGGFANKNAIALNAVARVLNGSANADDVNIVKNSPFGNDKRVIDAVKKLGPIPLSPGLNINDYIKKQPGEQVAQLKVPVDKLKIGNLSKEDMKIPPREGTYLSEGEKAIIENANNAVFRPVPDGMGASEVPVDQANLPPAKLGPAPDGTGAPEISVGQANLPPAADRPYIAGIDDLGAEGGSQGFTNAEDKALVDDLNANIDRELAKATNKNTETDAVDAVVEASNMMGEDGDSIDVTNNKGELKTVNSDILINAFKLNGSETDENLQLAVSDDIIKMGDRVIDGKPTNMDSLRKRIEALIPAVEEDPQTQGLLIAMLGASIAGGESPNALKNISDGMQKALPGLISFGSKQKAARQARKTSIAKLVLGEELKIAGEDRAVERAKTLRDNTPSTYLIRQSGEVGGQNFGKNSFTTLTAAQAATPEFAALRPIKIGEPTAKLEDILGIKDSSTNLKTLKLKGQIQKEYTRNLTLDNPFQIKGLKINYYKPTEVGKKLGGKEEGSFIEPREFAALTRGYKLKADPLVKLITRVNSLKEIDPKKMTGFTGMKQSFASTLRAFGGSKEEGGVLSKWANAWLDNEDLSAKDEFSLQGRYILAQIAPIFLNESGKTISDSDRARVAELLGFSIERFRNDQNEITGFKILGVNEQLLKNPDYVRRSINQVNSILTEKLNGIKNEYIMHSERFGTSKGFSPSKSLLANKLGKEGITPEQLLDQDKVLKVKQILAARKKKKP
jgi:hypothetical protein